MKSKDHERLYTVLEGIENEIDDALGTWGDFQSLHEGYAVLLEELDELWIEIKKKVADRDYDNLYIEAVQVSAMAAMLAMTILEQKGES